MQGQDEARGQLHNGERRELTRRFLALGGLVVAALAVLLLTRGQSAADAVQAQGARDAAQAPGAQQPRGGAKGHGGHHLPPPTLGSETYQYAFPKEQRRAVSEVFDPETAPAPKDRKVHEYTLVLEEGVEHEVAPGIKVPSWTFNRQVPGPVLRAREGELVRVKLVNKGSVPHSIHFHGVHPAEMDGVFGLVPAGGSFTYEFVAKPYGVFPYHCHANPTSQHIHNGLYGMMIVDPKEDRPPMRELAMVMSAFDLDRDGDADFYAWNGKAFQYADHPIDLKLGEPVRMYVSNIFEEMMAPHIHGNMFGLIRTGTALKPGEITDVVSLGIAERAILEFQYDLPGAYMFQCHFTEHMELGLMGWFRVGDVKPMKAGTRPAGDEHAHHVAEGRQEKRIQNSKFKIQDAKRSESAAGEPVGKKARQGQGATSESTKSPSVPGVARESTKAGTSHDPAVKEPAKSATKAGGAGE